MSMVQISDGLDESKIVYVGWKFLCPNVTEWLWLSQVFVYAEKNALSDYSLDQITGSDIAYRVWLVKSLIFLTDHEDHSFIAPF